MTWHINNEAGGNTSALQQTTTIHIASSYIARLVHDHMVRITRCMSIQEYNNTTQEIEMYISLMQGISILSISKLNSLQCPNGGRWMDRVICD